MLGDNLVWLLWKSNQLRNWTGGVKNIMGYNIGIGEAEINYYAEDNFLSISAEATTHPEAPDLGKGDVSGKGNYRYPSYCAFSNWCDETGLSDVFFQIDEERSRQRQLYGFKDPKCLVMQGGHPGAVPLTEEKWMMVKLALVKWRADHPNAIMPTVENTAHLGLWETDPRTVDGDQLDYTLGRLVWFEFWMRWALDNCKKPIISNS